MMRRRAFLGGSCALLAQACGGRSEMAHSLKLDHIQLLPGMRQDLATENAPAGTLVDAKNVRYGKSGVIYARPGTSLVSSATHGTAHEIQGSGGLSLLATSGSAAVVGTQQGKVFARDSTGGLWNFCGRFSTCLPLKKRSGLITEMNGGYAVTKYGNAANADGYVLTASSDGGGFTVALDSSSGARIYRDDALNGSKVLCVALPNGQFVLVAQNVSALVGYVFTVTAGVVTVTTGTVATLNDPGQYWDIAAGSASTWYLAYQSGATNLRLSSFTTASFTETTLVNETVAGNCPCSVWCDTANSRLWLGWQNDPGITGEVRMRGYGLTGTPLCAVTTLDTDQNYRMPLFGPPPSSGSVFFTFNRFEFAGEAVRSVVYGTATIAGAGNPVTISGSGTSWFVTSISKPDALQRSWVYTTAYPVVFVGTTGAWEQRALLLRWDTINYNGSHVELSCPTFETDSPAGFPTVDMFGSVSNHSGLCTFAIPTRLRQGGSFDGLYGIEVYQYESIERHPWRSAVQFAETLVVAGQPVEVFASGAGETTGATAIHGSPEVGFTDAPVIVSPLLASTGLGQLTLLGTYSYQVVREWIDMYGRRHRSQPSQPVSVTLFGTENTVELEISCPNHGERYEDAFFSYPVYHVYRTLNGEQTHYRVTPGSGAPVASSSFGLVSYTDTLSDANALLVGEALYTDAGLCDYNLAPSCRFVWRDERRVWFGGLWEADQVHCSLDLFPQQPLESSDFAGGNGPVFRVLIGEPVTAGAYQDGVNYVFTTSAIYAFSGDGPDRQGNGDFSKPRVLTRAAGCVDYRSVLVTSKGIFFQSARGIEILPRGGNDPIFIGAGIQDLLRLYPTCLGVALHSDRATRTARFLLRGGTNIVAVYDLDLGVWSYDEQPYLVTTIGEWPEGTAFGLSDQSAASCALLEPDDSALFSDNGVAYVLALTTHTIRPWGPAGFGRINAIVPVFTAPSAGDTLTLNVALDTVGLVGSKPWTLAAATGAQYREYTVAKEATSFDVRLSYTRALGTNTPGFLAYSVELQQLPGARRNPASSQ